MATKIIDNNGIVSFDSISSEEDLKLSPWEKTNLSRADWSCGCCGRHSSELKPFGKAGDPLVGDFDGALLIKKYRPAGPYDEEAEKAVKEAEKHLADDGYKGKDPLEWMIKKFGKEKGRNYVCSYMAYCQTGSSYECRECAVLDEDEYFEKLEQRYSKEG